MIPITVLLPSRERPTQLAAAVWSLWSLATDEGRAGLLRFIIVIDEDDAASLAMCRTLENELTGIRRTIDPLPLTYQFRPGKGQCQPTELLNDVIRKLDETSAVAIWNDRVLCLTPDWDRTMRGFLATNPTRICWWIDQCETQTPTLVFPPAYLDAVSRQWGPGLFPFWYNDLWHAEIDRLISRERYVLVPVACGGWHKQTMGSGEFRLWAELFIQTRSERIRIAERAAKRLGIEWTDPTEFIAKAWIETDEWMRRNADVLEARYGDTTRPPSEKYKELRQHAERWLQAQEVLSR